MFADAEAEVARLGEIPLLEFVFLDLQSTLQNFFGFGAADSDVDSNLFVTSDTECSDCVSGFAYW